MLLLRSIIVKLGNQTGLSVVMADTHIVQRGGENFFSKLPRHSVCIGIATSVVR